MKHITTYLSVLLVALFVSNAQSQFIEIRHEMTGTYHGWFRFGQSVLVFDTSVAPEIGTDGLQTYYAIKGQYFVHDASHRSTPFNVLDEEVNSFESAKLIYDPSNQEVFIRVASATVSSMTLRISEVSDGFYKGMGSLPDAPESYAMVDDYQLQSIEARVSPQYSAYWDGINGYSDGAVTYGARLVTELEPEACSPADLNQDGIVDFFDISIFIQLFMQGCP